MNLAVVAISIGVSQYNAQNFHKNKLSHILVNKQLHSNLTDYKSDLNDDLMFVSFISQIVKV